MKYLQKRLKSLGMQSSDLLSAIDMKGNDSVRIKYTDIFGQPYMYENETGDKLSYATIRVSEPIKREDGSEMKYIKPSGVEERPFLSAIHAYFGDKLDRISNIYITEGEFKALKMCELGIPTIGIAGIQSIAKAVRCPITKELVSAQLPTFLGEALHAMSNLSEITLLHDADAFSGSRNRMNNFHASVKRFAMVFAGSQYKINYAVIDEDKTSFKGADDVIVGESIVNPVQFVSTLRAWELDEDGYADIRKIFNMAKEAPAEKVKGWIKENYPSLRYNELSQGLELNGQDLDNRRLKSIAVNCLTAHTNEESKEMALKRVDGQLKYMTAKDKDKPVGLHKVVTYKQTISASLINDVLDSHDHIDSYHPFHEFINEQVAIHSGHTGSIKKWCDHIVLSRDASISKDFMDSAIRKWFIGVVAQIMDAQSVNLLMPVLISGVNTGKTYAVRRLFPKALRRYVSDWATNDTEQNTKMKACSNMLIINDEYSGMSKKEGSEFRQLLSADVLKYRAPYDKKEEEHVKTASFFATSNHSDVVLDAKNNRRIIPIELDYRIKELFDEIVPEQLWVEAYEAWKAGESFELTDEEVEHILEASKSNAMETQERDLVEKFVVMGQAGDMPLKSVEIKTALAMAQGLSARDINDRRLREALDEFGYVNKQYKVDGRPVRGYRVRLNVDVNSFNRY